MTKTFSYLLTPEIDRFHAPGLAVIHKSVHDRHLGMDVELNVGRNKTARRQPGWVFPAIGAPETPVLRLTRGQAYSGLHRDVYNDELSGVGMQDRRSSVSESVLVEVFLSARRCFATLERCALHSHAGAWERSNTMNSQISYSPRRHEGHEEKINFVSSATAPCVALPPASMQSFVSSW